MISKKKQNFLVHLATIYNSLKFYKNTLDIKMIQTTDRILKVSVKTPMGLSGSPLLISFFLLLQIRSFYAKLYIDAGKRDTELSDHLQSWIVKPCSCAVFLSHLLRLPNVRPMDYFIVHQQI